MDFETIDWEYEAERVRRAFGLEAECWFVLTDTKSSWRQLIQRNQKPYLGIALAEGENLFLYCNINKEDGRSFAVTSNFDFESEVSTHIHIKWDGTIHRDIEDNAYSDILAKGLFFLDLLTPEIEASLKPNISGHQKMEWAMEQPAHMQFVVSDLATYPKMDWVLEAQRVKDAFELVGECEVVEEEPNTFVLGGWLAGRRSISLDVIYRNHFQIFILDGWEEESAWLTILPDGNARYSSYTTYDAFYILAKGLYFLGLLSRQVETANDGFYSAYEKEKWQREYDARMKR